MLTIYTTGPDCHKCKLTKDRFEKAGVPFTEVRLDEVAENVTATLIASGHSVAPVVVDELTGDTWSDFRPDRIRAAIVTRGVNP